jgi:alginate O-acetyltransferase complex protein AlgI
MLFNSYEFLFLFLPLAFLLFWYAGSSIRWRLGLLTAASYTFYAWWQFKDWPDFVHSFQVHDWESLKGCLWHWRFTLIMLLSSSTDYWTAKWMSRLPAERTTIRRLLLALSLAVNLGFLGFFKYFGFFSQIASDVSTLFGGGGLPIFALVLPVGISFYTFESISYVIDVYRGIAKPAKSYLDYACFISFFPHLVAGPIIRYSDILHQFRDINWVRKRPDWEQVNLGLLFLTIGMAKKLLVADKIGQEINPLWNSLTSQHASLGIAGSWGAVLGYTFRIYFDFSGYSDMAVGLGHLFAVRLPQNFNSPYKATNPSDFWRRWHITLSTWLRDYLYIPLGGNRSGNRARNLMITMLLGGLWHGAAWLFIIWGAWHGLLLTLFHTLKKRNLWPSEEGIGGYWLGRHLTFFLVVIGWVFFRAADVHSTASYPSVLPAVKMFGQMFGFGGFALAGLANVRISQLWILIAMAYAWCNFAPNSYEIVYSQPLPLKKRYAVLAGATLALCALMLGVETDFLYFRF